MVIRFFKSNQSATLIVIPVVALLLWLVTFTSAGSVTAEVRLPSPMGEGLGMRVVVWIGSHLLFNKITGLILLILQSMFLNYLVNKHEVLYKRSHLPAFIYCLLMSMMTPFLCLHSILIVNTFLLLVLDKILSLYKGVYPLKLVFDASFLISLCSIFFFNSLVMWLLLVFSLVILRPFSWREWVSALIGLILPYYFLSIYLLFVGRLGHFWTEQFPSYFTHDWIQINPIPSSAVFLFSMTGFLLLIAFNKLRKNYYKNMIKTRNFQSILMLYLLFALISLALLPELNSVHFTLLFVPISIFISYYFLSAKKQWWLDFLVLVWIGLIVLEHIS